MPIPTTVQRQVIHYKILLNEVIFNDDNVYAVVYFRKWKTAQMPFRLSFKMVIFKKIKVNKWILRFEALWRWLSERLTRQNGNIIIAIIRALLWKLLEKHQEGGMSKLHIYGESSSKSCSSKTGDCSLLEYLSRAVKEELAKEEVATFLLVRTFQAVSKIVLRVTIACIPKGQINFAIFNKGSGPKTGHGRLSR